MSIATELSRIQTDRNTIRAKLVELGLAANVDNLDKLAAAIENIVNRGAVSLTVREGETVTIPAGYHNGSGTVSGVAGGGNYSLQSKTATPTKKQQNVTPDAGFYGLSDVTVAAIPDAYQDVTSVTAAAGDVLTGKVIVLADGTVTAGTMPNNGAVSKTLSATVIEYVIPKGYHSGTGKVTITLESKTVTPTKSEQVVTPSTGKVLEKVTVAPIPDNFIDTSDANAIASSILEGRTAYVDGVKVTGTMPDLETEVDTFHRLSPTLNEHVIEAGYHGGNETVQVNAKEQTVTPTKQTQTVQDASFYFKKVVVNPIPDAYQDVSGVTAHDGVVVKGSVFVNKNGELVEGSIEPYEDPCSEIDGLTKTSVVLDPGFYFDGVTVSLTDDIETALKAI